MRKRLKSTHRNRLKLNNYKKVYLIACWARYGVREYPFSGKFTYNEIWFKEPLVWDYDDHNGTYEEYILKPISYTTTGFSLYYCFDKRIAETIADAMNKKHNL